MRHGPKVWTEKVIEARRNAGAGSGTGDNYRPWLSVHDLSSRGRQTRISMRKLGRVVHVHSGIERAFVLVAEFQNSFVDVNEQWPIPREVTLGAAESLGIRHPTYPVSHVPVVMTVDFLLTTVTPDGVLLKTPWDCKREADLKCPRILEKLTIHRAAATHLGYQPSRLFTELSVPRQVIRNIERIRATLPLAGEPALIHELHASEQDAMFSHIATNNPQMPIGNYCDGYDKRRGFERGTALRVYAWLIWNHRVAFDLTGRNVRQQFVGLPRIDGNRKVAA